MGAENLAPTRFDPWTVQPIASHYTDSAILAWKEAVMAKCKVHLPEGTEIKN